MLTVMFQAHFGVCESTDAVTLNIWYTQWRCHSLKKPLLRCCRCLHFNSIIIFCLLRRVGFDCVKSIYVTLMTCHKTIISLYFSLHSKESPFICYSGRVLCAFETEVEVNCRTNFDREFQIEKPKRNERATAQRVNESIDFKFDAAILL